MASSSNERRTRPFTQFVTNIMVTIISQSVPRCECDKLTLVERDQPIIVDDGLEWDYGRGGHNTVDTMLSKGRNPLGELVGNLLETSLQLVSN